MRGGGVFRDEGGMTSRERGIFLDEEAWDATRGREYYDAVMFI